MLGCSRRTGAPMPSTSRAAAISSVRPSQAPAAGEREEQEGDQEARATAGSQRRRSIAAAPPRWSARQERDAVGADPGGERQGARHVDPGIGGEVPGETAAEVGAQPFERHPEGRQHEQAREPASGARSSAAEPGEDGVEEGEVGGEQAVSGTAPGSGDAAVGRRASAGSTTGRSSTPRSRGPSRGAPGAARRGGAAAARGRSTTATESGCRLKWSAHSDAAGSGEEIPQRAVAHPATRSPRYPA